MSEDDPTQEEIDEHVEKTKREKREARQSLAGSGSSMLGPVAPIKKMTLENQSDGNDRLHP